MAAILQDVKESGAPSLYQLCFLLVLNILQTLVSSILL